MFKKGQKVLVLARWDHLAKFYVREAVVHACGKKQMVLAKLDGECIGRNYLPAEKQWGDMVVVPMMDLEAAKARALEMAHEWKARELARFAECIVKAGPIGGPGYVAAIEKDIAALEAAVPCAIALVRE